MKTLPSENTFYFYRGRVALYALLRAMNLQPGDEVLIPGFTCVAVPSPILGMRARPVYVDIDPRTYNFDPIDHKRRVTSRSKVIVAQHTFGIPCDMDPIMETAQRHGLAVIEDTCHVWGSKYRGQDLGSIGVAAFYSYDPGKPFIIGMGGAATVNSEALRARMRDVDRLLSKSGVAIATWTSDALEGRLGPDYEKALSPSLRARLTAVMRASNQVISRHKRLAEQYERGLQAMGVPGLSIQSDSEAVLICYPLQLTNKVRVLEEARRHRVELGDWFSSPVHPLSEQEWSAVGYQKGSCPVAEEVSRHVVTLPCHAAVTAKEAERTLGFLKRMKDRGLLCMVALATDSGERSAAGGVGVSLHS